MGGAALCASQSFGRFGYESNLVLPSFELGREGFRARAVGAAPIAFEGASKSWRPLVTSEMGQVVQLDGLGRNPLKVRADLSYPGFALYFRNGFGFRFRTEKPPYVTWPAGSAGPNVPTPAAPWVLISFQDPQPPVLLAFEGVATSVRVSGTPGNWLLRSEAMGTSWVRVALPAGIRAKPTATAAELGAMAVAVGATLEAWTRPVPRLLRVQVESEPTAVTATWKFDGAGAVLPSALILAPNGGYAPRIESPITRIDAPTAEGPLAFATGNEIRVRFPVRRIPTGRALGVGSPPELIGTASYLDIGGVVELAMSNLLCSREVVTRDAGDSTLSEYLGTATYVAEPHTGQSMPYAADGRGVDLVAAHSLLMQALENNRKATSEGNALLSSVLLRRDWSTWRVWCPDPQAARRAGALAALAGAICPEPRRRLEAAMLQTGLAAERGFAVWTGQKDVSLIEPLGDLRRSLFGPQATHPFARLLLSEVRVYGDSALWSVSSPEGEAISWRCPDPPSPALHTLASAYPLSLLPGLNVGKLSLEDALGFSVARVTPEVAGLASLKLQRPVWASALPGLVAPPRYVE